MLCSSGMLRAESEHKEPEWEEVLLLLLSASLTTVVSSEQTDMLSASQSLLNCMPSSSNCMTVGDVGNEQQAPPGDDGHDVTTVRG